MNGLTVFNPYKIHHRRYFFEQLSVFQSQKSFFHIIGINIFDHGITVILHKIPDLPG